mgnify:FL=1
MKLIPTRPPGPNLRKARAFAAEIWQLRAQGHTFESIREALAAAGIQVSNSTVQREVARAARLRTAVTPPAMGVTVAQPMPPAVTTTTPAPTALPDPSVGIEPRCGKDIAEAFMRNRITNPLIRSR